MKKVLTLKEWSSLLESQKVAVTIGNFDGVHRGHQELLNHFTFMCKQLECACVVMSLYPHPALRLSSKNHHLLMNYEQKYESIYSLGVESIVEIPFDSVKELKGQQFYDKFLNHNNVVKIFVGHDFKLGCDRQQVQNLTSNPSEVLAFGPYKRSDDIVSSSLIREKIMQADITGAKELLGHNYIIRAQVVHGKKLGRSIGFPTVNLVPHEHILIPKNGVYAVSLNLDGKVFYGALNIGMNPSIDNSKNLKMEAHLIDFDGDLYGRTLDISLEEYIRSEKKFSDIDDLVHQIGEDVEFVTRRFHA